jgi:putative effector of murein hydrolase
MNTIQMDLLIIILLFISIVLGTAVMALIGIPIFDRNASLNEHILGVMIGLLTGIAYGIIKLIGSTKKDS